MLNFSNLLNHWKSLDLSDFLGVMFTVLNVLVIIGSVLLFKDFVRSKPDGRKTVLGTKLLIIK